MSWITPTWENSDHAGSNSTTGPSWVASVVNAVGESKYWDSTAIFIFWDDYGGWFDPVAPQMLDYDGPRLTYSDADHLAVCEEGLRLARPIRARADICALWRMSSDYPQLSASDARATSPAADAFDFNKPPRKFVPIKSPYDQRYSNSSAVERPPARLAVKNGAAPVCLQRTGAGRYSRGRIYARGRC